MHKRQQTAPHLPLKLVTQYTLKPSDLENRSEVESWLLDCPYRVQQILPPYRKPSYRKKTRFCKVKDIAHELSVELWNVDTKFGRPGKFINHPTNLPTIPLNAD